MKKEKNTLTLLTLARKFLKAGWLQGNMEGTVDKVKCYCAAGAVDKARRELRLPKYDGLVGEAFKALVGDRYVKVRTQDSGFSSSFKNENAVIAFNDKEGRTKQQVVGLFDRTITKLKKAEAK